MLNFKEVTLADKPIFDKYFALRERIDTDHDFGTQYLWARIYHYKWCEQDGWMFISSDHENEKGFIFPMGTGDIKQAVDMLKEYCEAEGITLRFVVMTAQEKDELEQAMPGAFEFTEDRDSFDYVYTAEKLSSLAGKKLHAKRNHINRFTIDYPDWVFEPLAENNLQDAWLMHHKWCAENDCDGSANGLEEEDCAVARAFNNFNALGLMGGLIRVDGKVVAYTMASPLGSNAVDVHFEKAFAEINGAYTIINREFVAHLIEIHPEIIYINREEDLGESGLRKAKESYYPEILVEKYRAVLR